MKKYFLFNALIITILVGLPYFGLPQKAALAATATDNFLTTIQGAPSNPGILPTNPFYFLKEWRRGIASLFTFNPVAKAELELRFANEKAAELVAIAEKEPQNEKAIEKALANYQKSKEKLAQKLESLPETSQNPNIEKLIGKVVEQEVKHMEVFDQVDQMLGGKDKIKTGHVTLLKRMAFEGASQIIAQSAESAIQQLPERELKPLRAIEIIDKLSEGLTPETAGQLIKVRQEYSEKLADKISKISESKGEEAKPEIISTIKSLPGDPVKHLTILEEIERNAHLRGIEKKDTRGGIVIGEPGIVSSAKEALIQEIGSQKDIKQKAEEQIKRAGETIKKLEEELVKESSEGLRAAPTESNLTIKTKSSPPRLSFPESQSSQALLEQAKEKLEKAKRAFEEGKYGEAFGLAVSAQSLAENGLRILLTSLIQPALPPTKTPEPPSKVPQPLVPPEKQQACPLIAPACPLENCLKSARELEAKYPGCNYASACEKQCQFEECGPIPAYPTKAGCKRICKNGQWQDICPTSVTPIPQSTELSKPNACGQIQCLKYDPVCGFDGKTYACGEADALACGTKVAYRGECRPTSLKPLPTDNKTFCTQEWNPVCGENGKTYTNECVAKIAGVNIKYRGECQNLTPATPETGTLPATTAAPAIYEFKLEADDSGFYPQSIITVPKGSKARIHFTVRNSGVYYGGLDFRSSKFKTDTVKPGGTTTVEFTADESFTFASYWSLSGVQKATGKVVVE